MLSESIMLDKSKELAISIIELCKEIMNDRREYILTKQLIRSGTSVGANIHEAQYSISKADFINKMQIALKEASETEYWLIVLERTGYYDESFSDVKQFCNSLKRMLTSTLNTAKASANI